MDERYQAARQLDESWELSLSNLLSNDHRQRSLQAMTPAVRIQNNQSVCREFDAKGLSFSPQYHTKHCSTSRPSFASRVVQFIFRRKWVSPAATKRSKSWFERPGLVASAPTPTPAALLHHTSASILAPSRPGLAASSAVPVPSRTRDRCGRFRGRLNTSGRNAVVNDRRVFYIHVDAQF
jgi:hypothetical protein